MKRDQKLLILWLTYLKEMSLEALGVKFENFSVNGAQEAAIFDVLLHFVLLRPHFRKSIDEHGSNQAHLC